LKNILENPSFARSDKPLSFGLGLNVSGNPENADLAKMPHLLIAGSTGSGKSICINSIIISFLHNNSPERLRMILIDPKRVELSIYNGIPHLLSPVISDPGKTVNALKWAVKEMEDRLVKLQGAGARDIDSFNTKKGVEKLPYIVIIIDELADLMASNANGIEAGIVRIAQMARAVGIHLIVSTQRPSVEVITGLIKANIPARIAFRVASQIDSRTILDGSGAEKLLGNGDMLFLQGDLNKPRRIQGAFLTEDEVKRAVKFIVDQVAENEDGEDSKEIDMDIPTFADIPQTDSVMDDDLYEDAKEIVFQAGKASASLLQRRLRIGYARAARLIDILEEQKVVGPADGARPREVYDQN
ncbi:DNA translocase FtsK, partial [bacterium]